MTVHKRYESSPTDNSPTGAASLNAQNADLVFEVDSELPLSQFPDPSNLKQHSELFNESQSAVEHLSNPSFQRLYD